MLILFTEKRLLLIFLLLGAFGMQFFFVEILYRWRSNPNFSEVASAETVQFYQSDVEKIARHWLIEALPILPVGSDIFRIRAIRVLDCDACYEVIYELGQLDATHRLELGIRKNIVRTVELDGTTDIFSDGSDHGFLWRDVVVTIEPLADGIGQERRNVPNTIGIRVLKAVSDDFKILPTEKWQIFTVGLAQKDMPRFLAEAVDNIRIGEQRRVTINLAQKGDLERASGKIFDYFSKLSFDIEAVAVNYP